MPILVNATARAIAVAAVFVAGAAGAQEPLPDLAGHFQQICGTTGEAGPALPGSDIAAADAPGFFASDLQRASESRVVRIGERYAMRALMPSSADPEHAVLLKCAVAAGGASFAEQVQRLSAMLSATPNVGKTPQGFDYAQFSAGMVGYSVYGELDGWVSIYRMDIMLRNIDPRYLRRGARPGPPPSVR
jgi:hypothetical protein